MPAERSTRPQLPMSPRPSHSRVMPARPDAEESSALQRAEEAAGRQAKSLGDRGPKSTMAPPLFPKPTPASKDPGSSSALRRAEEARNAAAKARMASGRDSFLKGGR